MNRSSTSRLKAAGVPLILGLSLTVPPAHGATLSLPSLGGLESAILPNIQDEIDRALMNSGGAKGAAPPVNSSVIVVTAPPEPRRAEPAAPRKPEPEQAERKRSKPKTTPSSARKSASSRPAPARERAPEREEEKAAPRPVESAQPPEAEVTGKDSVTGKEPLDALPAAAPAPPLALIMSTSWLNKVYFRGLDIMERVSPDDVSAGASSSVIKLVKGNWEGGLQYIQGLEQQRPDGALADQDPNAVDANGNPTSRNEAFRIPSRERYSEVDLWLKYSRPIIPNKLDATVGLTHYRFSDDRFWGIGDATEVQLGTSYTGLKYVVPSLTYAWDFNGFEGSYLEFAVTGRNLPGYRRGNFGIDIQPYARVAYDFEYNGVDDGWNNAEVGVNLPIKVSRNFVLSLSANYSLDLGDRTGGLRRTDDGFWGGVTLTTATTFNKFNSAQVAQYGKDVLPPAAPAPTKWSLSAGAGTRSISADFEDRPVFLTPALNLVSRLVDKGTLDSGKAGLEYGDGSIGADRPGFGQNPSGLAGYTGGTATGSFGGGDKQILFTSDRYLYSNRTEGFSFRSEDEDRVIYPYLDLNYDLGAPGGLSTGLRYAFARGEFDSGVHLSSLDRADETYTRHLFLYDGNNLVDDNTLIYNSDILRSQLGDRPVQKGTQGLRTEKTKIATFVQSSVDIDLHSLTVPLQWTVDIGDRAHISLSAGPTINLFNADLSTTAWSRDLDNLAGGRLLYNNVNFRTRRGVNSGDYVEVDTSGNSGLNPALANGSAANEAPGQTGSTDLGANAPSVPAGAKGSAAAAARRSGGKGGTARAPRLPGRDVGSRTWTESENRFEWGVSAQTTFRWDLDEADRWFIELWGRYDYVNPFTMSTPVSSVEIDASSWGVGAGIGFRF